MRSNNHLQTIGKKIANLVAQAACAWHNRPMQTKFTKVSEWVKNGCFDTGMYLIERDVTKETEKAIGLAAEKVNSCGNLKPATCFLPKSKVLRVQNDFYINGPKEAFLIPEWLFKAKLAEGYSL